MDPLAVLHPVFGSPTSEAKVWLLTLEQRLMQQGQRKKKWKQTNKKNFLKSK